MEKGRWDWKKIQWCYVSCKKWQGHSNGQPWAKKERGPKVQGMQSAEICKSTTGQVTLLMQEAGPSVEQSPRSP